MAIDLKWANFLRIIVRDCPSVLTIKYRSVAVEGGAQAVESTVKLKGQSQAIVNTLSFNNCAWRQCAAAPRAWRVGFNNVVAQMQQRLQDITDERELSLSGDFDPGV